MIIARAPMFVNFIGDSSYSKKAISAAIDKYVYVVINPTPLVNHVSARYSVTESVPFTKDLRNERVREALLKFGIKSNIEVGSFASFPMEIGFKSFLSFTSALVCGLHSNLGSGVSVAGLAQEVFEIERKALSKNYSIQGAHSTSGGGINIFSFGDEGNYKASPVFIDFHERLKFESLINVYYVKLKNPLKVKAQRKEMDRTVVEATSTMVDKFKESLVNGEVEESAFILHKSWMLEQNIGINYPPDIIHKAYERAIAKGALGGKYVGDQESGCLIVLSNPIVLRSVDEMLKSEKEIQFSKFKVGFVQSGARTIFNLKNE